MKSISASGDIATNLTAHTQFHSVTFSWEYYKKFIQQQGPYWQRIKLLTFQSGSSTNDGEMIHYRDTKKAIPPDQSSGDLRDLFAQKMLKYYEALTNLLCLEPEAGAHWGHTNLQGRCRGNRTDTSNQRLPASHQMWYESDLCSPRQQWLDKAGVGSSYPLPPTSGRLENWHQRVWKVPEKNPRVFMHCLPLPWTQ